MILSIPDPECRRRKTALSVDSALREYGRPAQLNFDPDGNAHNWHAADPNAPLAPHRLGLPRVIRRRAYDHNGKAPAWAGIEAATVTLPAMATLQAEGAA